MSVIGKSDGPTAVTVIKRNSKLTWKQKLEKCKYKIKRAYVEHTIKAKGHSLDEVIDYIINKHGFVEIDNDEVWDFSTSLSQYMTNIIKDILINSTVIRRINVDYIKFSI